MKRILPAIVIAQFFCTSMWFAGNAVIRDLAIDYHLNASYLAWLTSAVQAGFITGTLAFALFGIADRFSPSKVFFLSALIAGVFNLAVCLNWESPSSLLAFRFLTGFFLAGIYPVGMKIASDHFKEGLGKSLGYLVGALVLGTALPHLLTSLPSLAWKYVFFATSLLSALGGMGILLLVPDGPLRKQGMQLKLRGFLSSFRNAEFRSAAIGYFGHMWELYAFWVFVPVMLSAFQAAHAEIQLNISLLSFLIIAAGSVSCVAGGYISQRFGIKRTATSALLLSGTCCLLSPLFLTGSSAPLLILFLLAWSSVVVADSPLFSTLVAKNAVPEFRGSALTIVNCIGFAITIVSIQVISMLTTTGNVLFSYMVLAAGPVAGLIGLRKT